MIPTEDRRLGNFDYGILFETGLAAQPPSRADIRRVKQAEVRFSGFRCIFKEPHPALAAGACAAARGVHNQAGPGGRFQQAHARPDPNDMSARLDS